MIASWFATLGIALVAIALFVLLRYGRFGGSRIIGASWVGAAFVVVFTRTAFTAHGVHQYLLYRGYPGWWVAVLWIMLAVLATWVGLQHLNKLNRRLRRARFTGPGITLLFFAVFAPFNWVFGLWFVFLMVFLLVWGGLSISSSHGPWRLAGCVMVAYAIFALAFATPSWDRVSDGATSFAQAFQGENPGSHAQGSTQVAADAPPKGATSVAGQPAQAAQVAPPAGATITYLVTGTTQQPSLRVGCSEKAYCTSLAGKTWITRAARRMANLSGTPWQVQAFTVSGTSVGTTPLWSHPALVKNTKPRSAAYNQQWCVGSQRLLGVTSNGKCIVGSL